MTNCRWPIGDNPVRATPCNRVLTVPSTIGNWKLAIGNSARTLDALFRESCGLGGRELHDQSVAPPVLRRRVRPDGGAIRLRWGNCASFPARGRPICCATGCARRTKPPPVRRRWKNCWTRSRPAPPAATTSASRWRQDELSFIRASSNIRPRLSSNTCRRSSGYTELFIIHCFGAVRPASSNPSNRRLFFFPFRWH